MPEPQVTARQTGRITNVHTLQCTSTSWLASLKHSFQCTHVLLLFRCVFIDFLLLETLGSCCPLPYGKFDLVKVSEYSFANNRVSIGLKQLIHFPKSCARVKWLHCQRVILQGMGNCQGLIIIFSISLYSVQFTSFFFLLFCTR